ncbi:MAG TPA: hypothetical protein VGO65_01840 [Pseudolysinimonas sp.]|nr:hypothetical protein [Pseudolysinimonas sp.]
MKVFAFLVALAFFVGSFLMFGYAFAADPGFWQYFLFGGGLLAVAVSLAIPFHLLEKFD